MADEFMSGAYLGGALCTFFWIWCIGHVERDPMPLYELLWVALIWPISVPVGLVTALSRGDAK